MLRKGEVARVAQEVLVQVVTELLPDLLEKLAADGALAEDASGLVQIRGREDQHNVGIGCESLLHSLEVGRVLVDRVPSAEVDDATWIILKHAFYSIEVERPAVAEVAHRAFGCPDLGRPRRVKSSFLGV